MFSKFETIISGTQTRRPAQQTEDKAMKIFKYLTIAFIGIYILGLFQSGPVQDPVKPFPVVDPHPEKNRIGYNFDTHEYKYMEDNIGTYPSKQPVTKYINTKSTKEDLLENMIYDLEFEDIKQYMAD